MLPLVGKHCPLVGNRRLVRLQLRIFAAMKKRTQNGFTLYELLITILIVGIVLTIGIPNLRDFTRNSRISGTTNDLHGSFLLARSEAARAKENVTICASINSMDDDAGCGGTFEDGWIIFVDLGAKGSRDDVATEHLLKAFPSADTLIGINTGGAGHFTFAPNGLGDEIDPFIAMICDERGNTVSPGGNSAARRLVVTPMGRPTIIRNKQTIADSVTESEVSCAT